MAKTSAMMRGAGLVVVALAAALASGSPVRPQTASQITPPTFRPELPRIGGAVVFSGAPGLDAPPGSDRLSITLSGVTVEGGRPELAAEEAALEARLVGGPVAVSDLFAAARALEAAYADAGFVLVRVTLPPQELRDGGRLRLVLVDGFIERIDAGQLPAAVRGRTEAVLAPLVGERGLRLPEIERQLLIAGDTPGVALRSTLSAGDQPGGTVLTVEARYRPVTGFVSLDNTLASDLGRWTLGLGLDANSLLGHGETFYLRAFGYPGFGDDGFFGSDPLQRILAVGVVAPIGTNGLTVNVEYTDSRTNPEASRRSAETASDFERLTLGVAYPVIETLPLAVTARLSFDAQSEDQWLRDPYAELSSDDLRILRLTGEATWRRESGAELSGRAILSFGLDAFGARTQDDVGPNDPPLSREGADASFQKLEVAVGYTHPLPAPFGLKLLARGQTSFGEPLALSEQIGIASFEELSTFDAGTIGGDAGYVARADLTMTRAIDGWRMPLILTPYAFAATGAVYLEEPTALERRSTHASSFGIGLDLTAVRDPDFSDASITVEFGRGLRDDDEPDENRFTLVAAFRF
ncbi:ShlB/FhaC/HecB family hemolysin secretion/activation protein [Amaricoccus sp.]|uniref:ShlB/FhaC/HecB family hemolysin secretion/activation protein n=1 Tax=Amaricoccus sp. TaxID=1872485 RepID=UPI001B712584|nr:ShlB/FhaC/HecB family hemolysin secretion/activation protein [Amaricoccus sp.]MBP7002429.1 ShlB/FhaC/HecB family hemolysin secretion/activation protein [Amaricoccus sp.]